MSGHVVIKLANERATNPGRSFGTDPASSNKLIYGKTTAGILLDSLPLL
jgi:hypothetical protein